MRVHDKVRSLLAAREAELKLLGRILAWVLGSVIALLIIGALLFAQFFGPAGATDSRAQFIVEPEDTLLTISQSLEQQGLVRHAAAFRVAYRLTRSESSIRPGGYSISPDMDTLAIAKTLGEAPYLAWVVVPEGKRKEEIADLLTQYLGWTKRQQEEWLAATDAAAPLSEGVFYADTYLIPSDQSPAEVAERMRARFEEAVAPLAPLAAKTTLSWSEVVTLASLVERESAKNDKALVAGILKNRLDRGMLLQVDATLQYLRGTEEKWWPAPDVADKDDESPYNTYVHKGLPPAPIATPSLASIEAVLEPQATKCLYYLHDAYGRIHCSTNYQAHLSNVNRYLK